MKQHLDIGAVIGESILVIADVADDVAGDLRDHLAIDHRMVAVPAEQRRLSAAFSGNDDLVGGAEGLAAEPRIHQTVVGNPKLDVVLEESVEDRIRDLIADLVGMTFRYGLAGEEVVGV